MPESHQTCDRIGGWIGSHGGKWCNQMMTYFDSREPFDHDEMVHLDRVYRLAWHFFTDAHWQQLDAIYKRLPGWCGYDPVPWWFGKEESVAPHLTASVEPPG